MKTVALIVAAGRGTRAPGGDVPKQYRMLAGQTVLGRTIGRFAEHEAIDAIQTVIHQDDRALYEAATRSPSSSSLLAPVPGGSTRQASVCAGLRALKALNPHNVLIHDAARPFPPASLIGRVVSSLGGHDGVVPALPVTDTLKQVGGDRITATIDRRNLWRAQTPQGFAYPKILGAHEAAAELGKSDFTDDSSLAEWHGLAVAVVEGDIENTKLTSLRDFDIAEQRLACAGGGNMGETRVGQGFDVHAFGDGDHVMLCGVAIPHDRGLTGHSDADVALHALTDALLGTVGDGDIGTHFPPSDPQWRGAASDTFLLDAARRVADKGAVIMNVDITLICERPKIGPHRDAMRARVAEILKLEIGRVSVKATTTEGLGFTGRGEGIAAQVAATVRFD